MAIKVATLSFKFTYSIIFLTTLSFIPTLITSLTLSSDVQALSSIKRAIDPSSIPPLSYLDSWDFTQDPCSSTGIFLGILCSYPLDNSSSRVVAIDVDVGGYDGFLATSIGNLTELTVVNLGNNKFRGPIPETLSNLKKLTRLSLADNFFTGAIPTGLTDLKQLTSIDLSRNNLSGTLPPTLPGLRSLTRLSLSSNRFTGRIPNLDGLWQLDTLDLSSNQFYGNLPKLPISLRTLSLSHNILTGPISSIRRLERLGLLDLSDNKLTDNIPKEVIALPELVQLNLSLNQFTVMEVNMFTDMATTQLQVLDVQRNRLHGRLPINLVTMGSLVSINLSRNMFSGRIPNEYGTKLGRPWRHLFLDNNFLTGNPPPQFISRARVQGSLAHNCLNCPNNILMCRGGQKAAPDCVGHTSGNQ